MKTLKCLILTAVAAGVMAVPFAARAADTNTAKPKPYPLTTCVVSGEKLGGDMGDPYVFMHEGREVKLCCKSCLKDFNKNPAKYMKKIETADKVLK